MRGSIALGILTASFHAAQAALPPTGEKYSGTPSPLEIVCLNPKRGNIQMGDKIYNSNGMTVTIIGTESVVYMGGVIRVYTSMKSYPCHVVLGQ